MLKRIIHGTVAMVAIFMGIFIPMLLNQLVEDDHYEWNERMVAIATIQVALMGLLAWQHARKAMSGMKLRSPIQMTN